MAASSASFLVRSIVSANRVAVFSKSYCPFCDMAKKALDDAGADRPCVIELDHRKDSKEIQAELAKLTKVKTVPYVFIDKQYVGGGTTVKDLHDKGQLKQLV